MRGRSTGAGLCAAAIATVAACAGTSADHAALEQELSRARGGLGVGRAADIASSVRASGTRRLEILLPPTALRGAGGLACHEGRIYVTEPLANRVSTVRADGSVGRVGTPSGFTLPMDLAFDDAGVMYVASAEAGGLWRREPTGAWRRVAPELSDLGGVVALGGSVLVAECAQGGRLLRLDPDDGRILELLATDLGCPGRISVGDDGAVLIPLREHGQVISFDPATKTRALLARDLDIPSAAGVAPDGARIVLESGTGRVRVLAASGDPGRAIVSGLPGLADVVVCGETLVLSNAATGSLRAYNPWPTGGRILVPGGLVVPAGITFDGEDLLIADRASIKRIRHGQIELLVLSRFDGMPPPVGLTGGLPGIVWITSPELGELVQVDLTRAEATRITSGLDWPTSVLRTQAGELVIAETGAGRVVRLGVGAIPYTIASGLMSPVALATRGGRIMTAEPEGGRVISLRSDAPPTVLSSGLAAPAGLATARGRPLYIAEERKGILLVRSGDGTERRAAEGLALRTARGDHPFPVPVGIASDGSVVVASPEDGSVVRISPY